MWDLPGSGIEPLVSCIGRQIRESEPSAKPPGSYLKLLFQLVSTPSALAEEVGWGCLPSGDRNLGFLPGLCWHPCAPHYRWQGCGRSPSLHRDLPGWGRRKGLGSCLHLDTWRGRRGVPVTTGPMWLAWLSARPPLTKPQWGGGEMFCHCQLGMEFWTPHVSLQTPPERGLVSSWQGWKAWLPTQFSDTSPVGTLEHLIRVWCGRGCVFLK